MKETTGLWKKAAAIAFLVISLSFGTAYAEGSVETIYHVYVGDKPVGIVDSKQKVQEHMNQRLDEEQEKHEDYEITYMNDVRFFPEKKFTPDFDPAETIDRLDKEIKIGVEAVGLQVDGETVGFLPNEEKAESVVQEYKEKFVDEEALKEVEERKEAGENPEIEESTIINVKLTEEVEHVEKVVEPEDIIKVEKAADLLEEGMNEEKVHQAEKGQAIQEIAYQYDLSQDDLLEMNPQLEEKEVLDTSQEIKVMNTGPLTEVLIKEEGKKTKKIPYKTEVVETDELEKGTEKVKQKGKDGEKEVHYYKTKINDRTTDEGIIKEKEIKEPVKEIVLKGTKVIPSKGTGNFGWPAVGGSITSKQGERWGSFHKGIDIAGVSDRTIRAADNGKVVSAGRDGAYGNKVVIDHNNGYRTTYAHLKSISVNVGDVVEKGSSIGQMGTTGRSTGVHLHFEIHKNGSLINPMDHL
ncbi:peptidoglycan DD-metalloendopeptidase family protein [Halobacillus sp. Marseille-Q1614]|uniref:peptidoglycan DD-metalloendopeptidase family protein n=1 Tax=Halobacillus sp. Marseille-Q1614 TaxID=2709134 RepID=UPI00156FD0F2|nr:M23 family metallopeptidase [Halobacillus sp. Marseille-Q1614]